MRTLSYLLFLIIIPSVAGARPKSQSIKDHDIGLLAMAEDGNFRDCSRSMKSSSRGKERIPVCLHGNGMYQSLGAIRTIASKDWLKGEDFVASQIEEVRFICSPNPSLNILEPNVTFPNQSEALAGRKLRINIPCRLSKIAAIREFEKMLNLVRTYVKSPDAIAQRAESKELICDSQISSVECTKFKQFVSRILSGEAIGHFMGVLTYCQTFFSVGLDGSAKLFSNIRAPQRKVDWAEALGLPPNPTEKEDLEWVDGETKNCRPHDFKKCTEDINRLRMKLGRFAQLDGTVAYLDGKRISCLKSDAGTHKGLGHLLFLLFCLEDGVAMREAQRLYEESPDFDKASIRGSPADWERAVQINGPDLNSPILKGPNHLNYFRTDEANDGCGIDLDCHLRQLAVSKQILELKNGNQKLPDCFQITGVTVADRKVTLTTSASDECEDLK